MKKNLSILFFLLNVSIIAAQEGLRMGVNLDLMASWLSAKTNLIQKDGTRPGISGGLTLEYFFRPNYGIVTGFNVGTQGGGLKYEEPVSIRTGDNTSVTLDELSTVVYNLNYITVPVGIKLKTNEIGYLTYFAHLGFNQQFNIGATASSTGNALNKDNVPKETNLLHIAYFFGGGFEYNIGGQTSFVAGIFYNNGFIDVLSNNAHKAVFNYLTLRAGILF